MNRVLSRMTSCFLIALVAITAGCARPDGSERAPSSNANAAPATPAPPAREANGGIKVVSTPAGATILLIATDEAGASPPEPRGTTPATLEDLAPGKYAVHLELRGYKSFQKEVDVKAGEVVSVNATLRK